MTKPDNYTERQTFMADTLAEGAAFFATYEPEPFASLAIVWERDETMAPGFFFDPAGGILAGVVLPMPTPEVLKQLSGGKLGKEGQE